MGGFENFGPFLGVLIVKLVGARPKPLQQKHPGQNPELQAFPHSLATLVPAVDVLLALRWPRD